MKENISAELLEFISRSPDSFHAAQNAAEMLLADGYTELIEGEAWKIKLGGKYFVRRNMSALIAFALPKKKPAGFMLAAAHGDSPCFKIKDNPDIISAGSDKLNVEKYGGTIYSTWLDRPLSVSGRIVVRTPDGITTKLVNLDRDLLCIPSLAIHMNRSVNDGYKFTVSRDMLPILGNEDSGGALMRLIADSAKVAQRSILGSDLFVYSRTPGWIWGAKGEYMSSPRLDDLQCAFSLLKGFLGAKIGSAAPVYALFDNEEVGSGTKQGAAATFLKDTLMRVSESLGMSAGEYRATVASSFMLSADNAHAIHPNHTDCADVTNRPTMNGGVVLKFNGDQKYTTDAVSAALLRSVCAKVNVPVQEYYNQSDIAGGSTLGHLSNAQVAVNMADIGIAQLAMHSACETAGTADTDYLISTMKEFFSSSVTDLGMGAYKIGR